jgi:uncharacterized protein YihD (DUF1040 family)
MEHKALVQRPISRIKPVLSRIEKLWHYYPKLSLAELVLEITQNANKVGSVLTDAGMSDIEDNAYPEGHFLHESRHLEMGIEIMEKQHQHTPLPPTPIQAALLGKVEDHWRKNPQMRLGQLLSNAHFLASLE